MNEALKTLPQTTSKDLSSVTFSQALEGGLTHYDWLDGLTIDQCGRDLALASHSASQEKEKEQQTSVTYGPLFAGSSPSADLQRSLENRLLQRLEGRGSPEYALTLKHWDMDAGEPIFALRASGRRTSGKDSGGWATPAAKDGSRGPVKGGLNENMERVSKQGVKYGRTLVTMAEFVRIAGWPTTRAGSLECYATREKRKGHTSAVSYLEACVEMAGWPTTSVRDQKGGYQGGRIRNGKMSTDTLDVTAQLAGYPTPQCMDTLPPMDYEKRLNHPSRPGRKVSGNLREVVTLHGWPTLTATDAIKGGKVSPRQGAMGLSETVPLTGLTQSCGRAETASGDVYLPDMRSWNLNANFSLWLMGYPISWGDCGRRAMKNFSPSPRKKKVALVS